MNLRLQPLLTTFRWADLPRKGAIAVLRGYKWALSPLFLPGCRYRPTCSEYAMEALDRYGLMRGGFLAAWRVLRCNPFVKGGYDPVWKPESTGEAAGPVRLCKH